MGTGADGSGVGRVVSCMAWEDIYKVINER